MSKDSGAHEIRQQMIQEQQRQAEIRQGVSNINTTFDKQFTPQFYDQQRDAFSNYMLPQLDTQNAEANRQLTYALARSGTLNSSIRGTQQATLQRDYDTQRQNISDQAIANAAKAKSGVEEARADLIRTVQASGDAAGATSQAIARADALSKPAAYSPLTDVFSTFVGGLGKQAALEQSFANGSPYAPRYNTGLFGTPSNAVKVTS